MINWANDIELWNRNARILLANGATNFMDLKIFTIFLPKTKSTNFLFRTIFSDSSFFANF